MAAGETRHQFAGFNNKCGAVVTFCPVLHCMNKIIYGCKATKYFIPASGHKAAVQIFGVIGRKLGLLIGV